MSHSAVHQEKRRVRANLMQKMNRILRNAGAGGRRTFNYPGPMSNFDFKVTRPSWWNKLIARIKNFLRRIRAWSKNLNSR